MYRGNLENQFCVSIKIHLCQKEEPKCGEEFRGESRRPHSKLQKVFDKTTEVRRSVPVLLLDDKARKLIQICYTFNFDAHCAAAVGCGAKCKVAAGGAAARVLFDSALVALELVSHISTSTPASRAYACLQYCRISACIPSHRFNPPRIESPVSATIMTDSPGQNESFLPSVASPARARIMTPQAATLALRDDNGTGRRSKPLKTRTDRFKPLRLALRCMCL